MTALIVAVAGTAMAAPIAIKSVLNKKEKKQVKNISKSQADNQITARASGLSVASAQNANNANSANSANAVDGLSGATFKRTYTTTTVFENIMTLDGLTIRARCIDAGGATPDQLDLDAISGVDGAEVSVDLVGTGDSAQHNIDLDFNSGDAFDMRPGDLGSSSGTIVFSTDGGSVVTVNYWGAEVFLGLGCQLAGVGFGTS